MEVHTRDSLQLSSRPVTWVAALQALFGDDVAKEVTQWISKINQSIQQIPEITSSSAASHTLTCLGSHPPWLAFTTPSPEGWTACVSVPQVCPPALQNTAAIVALHQFHSTSRKISNAARCWKGLWQDCHNPVTSHQRDGWSRVVKQSELSEKVRTAHHLRDGSPADPCGFCARCTLAVVWDK